MNNKEWKHELHQKGKYYEYKSSVATYQLRFIPEPGVFSKCGILCHRDKLNAEVINAIVQWEEPQELDCLDLKVNAYDTIDFGGTIYFMSSFTVKIELIELHQMTNIK